MSSSVLELEQKFVISPNATNERLHALGFHPTKDRHMVDWYFDFQSLSYPLVRRDTWLRYRHALDMDDDGGDDNHKNRMQQGQWELKRGPQDQGGDSVNAVNDTTVYEEIAGNNALEIVRNMFHSWEDKDPSESPTREEYTARLVREFTSAVPLPEDTLPGLIPFARIVTHRSSWKVEESNNDEAFSKYAGVSVDLDQTDFGYNVGEVEVVVPTSSNDDDNSKDASSSAVRDAKRLIQELIDLLSSAPAPGSAGEASSSMDQTEAKAVVAKGKLEYFLQTQRPEVYSILEEVGLAR